MKDRQFHIYLNDEEYGQVLQALIALKNNLIAQGRYAEGKFTYNKMDDLINFCAEHMANENWTSEQVREYMAAMLPKLNYWKCSDQ